MLTFLIGVVTGSLLTIIGLGILVLRSEGAGSKFKDSP